MIRKNTGSGLHASQGMIMLRGGTITANKRSGVVADRGSKVTVAKAEEGKPQTISKDNMGNAEQYNWCIGTNAWDHGSEIIGIPQDNQRVARSEYREPVRMSRFLLRAACVHTAMCRGESETGCAITITP